MKKLIYFSIIFFLLSACTSDENALNDYELFGRLQSGSGTWRITEIIKRDNSQTSPEEIIENPENAFYHFYVETREVFNTLIDMNHATMYIDDDLVLDIDVQAEPLRVAFTDGSLGKGEVWTVIENKAKSQEWHHVEGNTTTIMRLKKCNCDIPESNISEIEG